jgi:signal peptidase II
LIREKAQTLLLVSIGLIFAGAFGNIIDSMFYGLLFSESYGLQTAEFLPATGGYAPFLYGNVVDMISFSFFPPIFNIADSSITIGVALLILKQKTFFNKKKDTIGNENTKTAVSDSAATTEDTVA